MLEGPQPLLEGDSRHGRNALFGATKFLIPTAAASVSTLVIFAVIGAEEFGVYSLAVAAIGIVSGLQGGITAAIVKRVSEAAGAGSGDIARTARTVVGAGLSLAAVAVALLVLAGAGTIAMGESLGLGTDLRRMAVPILGWATAAGAASLLFTPFIGVCEGLERYDITAGLMSVRGLLNAVTDVSLILFTGSLPLVLALRTANNTATGAASAWFVKRIVGGGKRERLWPSRQVTAAGKDLIGYGYNLSAASLAGALTWRGLYFVTSATLGPGVTGVFSLVNELASKVHQVIASASEFLFPVASRSFAAGSTSGLNSLLRRAYLFAGVLGFPLLIGVILVASGMVERTYTTPPGVPKGFLTYAVWVLPVTYYLHGLSSFEYAILNGYGRPHINRNYNVLLAICTLGLATVLSLWVGAGGLLMAVSTSGLGSVIYIGIVSRYIAPRRRGFFKPVMEVVAVGLTLGLVGTVWLHRADGPLIVWIGVSVVVSGACYAYICARGIMRCAVLSLWRREVRRDVASGGYGSRDTRQRSDG